MRRTLLITGVIAVAVGSHAEATSYVAGKIRDDGLYVPPHFTIAVGQPHAAERWFDRLQGEGVDPGAGSKTPPPAGDRPPSRPIGASRL